MIKQVTEIAFLENFSIFLGSECCRGLTTTRVSLPIKIKLTDLVRIFFVDFLEHNIIKWIV